MQFRHFSVMTPQLIYELRKSLAEILREMGFKDVPKLTINSHFCNPETSP